MSAENYYDGGDLSREEIDVESHFFPGGVDKGGKQDLSKVNPDPIHLGYSEAIIKENTADPNELARRRAEETAARVAAAGLEQVEENILYDEHSNRNERAAALSDERMDMRAEYNLHEFELTPDDRSNLERITDRGRQAFNGLLNIRGIDRKAARFGMKFDQHFLDKSNEEIIRLRAQVTQIDDRIKLFNQRNEAAAAAAAVNNTGIDAVAESSMADLLTRARNEKIGELQREREQLMAKIGKHEADAKLSETNRNRYVDWMVRKNNKMLAPLEAKKMRYQDELRVFDEKNAPLIVHFQRLKAEVEFLEKERVNGIKEAEEMGLRGKELEEAKKEFDGKIERRRKVLEEWEEKKAERARKEQQIAALGAKIKKADRRDEYQAILNKKPLLAMPQAERSSSETGPREEVRVEAQDQGILEEEVSQENAGEKFNAGDLLKLWKEHFAKKVNKGFTIGVIVEKWFSMDEDEKITVDEFKKKLSDHYDGRFPESSNEALRKNIQTALDSFGGNGEELRIALRGMEGKRQETKEAPKLWIQDAVIQWNNFLQKQLALELKNDADLGKSILLNPGDFVRKDDILQNVNLEEFKAIAEKCYQDKPELSANLRGRLEQEYINFLESQRESQA